MLKKFYQNIIITLIVSILLVSCSENQSKTLPKNNIIPTIFSYEIINEFPHDINAYTQGLEFYNGDLYESIEDMVSQNLEKLIINLEKYCIKRKLIESILLKE